jgi:hypothetical protein
MASARRRTVGVGVGLVAVFVVLILGLGGVGRAEAQGWSVPKNMGEEVNSSFAEDLPHIAGNGRSLYFISNRPGFGSFDIWVSQRATPHHPWGPPVNVGPAINTSFNERGPCLSPDGHYLFFSSDRTDGGLGSQDLWRSYREDTSDDFGWQAPENLGAGVNTEDPDFGAALLEHYHETFSALLFGRRQSFEDADIYMSRFVAGSFKTGVLVKELSTPYDDLRPTIRPDGLELFFNSNRPVPHLPQSNDLWVSTRNNRNLPWSTPVNAGSVLNTQYEEQFPALSRDGKTLIFSSNRPGSIQGSNDLYLSRRESVPVPSPWP